jgi:hypothetical protein
MAHSEFPDIRSSETHLGLRDDCRYNFKRSRRVSPARSAYPIARYQWFILPADPADRVKKEAVVEFVQWSLTAGQSAGLDGYVPIPQSIAASALREVQRQ